MFLQKSVVGVQVKLSISTREGALALALAASPGKSAPIQI